MNAAILRIGYENIAFGSESKNSKNEILIDSICGSLSGRRSWSVINSRNYTGIMWLDCSESGSMNLSRLLSFSISGSSTY